jgi:nucleotide-binding universal stress UspA family protein
MSGFHSIVCAVDFSDHSVHALRCAVGLAGHDRASLTVMTVNDPLLVEAAAASALGADYVEKDAEKELRALIARVVPAGAAWSPTLEIAIRTGKAEVEILKCAAERGADLIVMGTHGLSGVRKMFFGSVTERVLRQTSIPVLAAPLTDRSIVSQSDRQPIVKIGTMMAPVDLGPSSEQQARTAAALAQRFDASLLLVHVQTRSRTGSALGQAVTAYEQRHGDAAHEQLARLAADAGPGIRVDTHIASGQPADEIARVAVERNVDLIVMGLTGEGSAAGRPGSVAYRVLTLAPVPVLALA